MTQPQTPIQNGTYTQPYERPLGLWTLTVQPDPRGGQTFVLESDHTYPEEVGEAYARQFIEDPRTVQEA